MEEGRPPESIFDFVQGITRLARDKTQQDAPPSTWRGAPRSSSTESADAGPRQRDRPSRAAVALSPSKSMPLAPPREDRGLRPAYFSEAPMTPQEETIVLEARDILGRYLSQNPVHRQLAGADGLLRADRPAARVERFHVLYLDRKNRIISDELLSTGTVDHVPVYPREVIKRGADAEPPAPLS